jgi:hypothetical protein
MWSRDVSPYLSPRLITPLSDTKTKTPDRVGDASPLFQLEVDRRPEMDAAIQAGDSGFLRSLAERCKGPRARASALVMRSMTV